MCLYPRLIKNRKYTSNKKNGGKVPAVNDKRSLYVPIGCQNCIECRKKKSREWNLRLQEDIKEHTNGKFITLTFSNESIAKIIDQFNLHSYKGYTLDNKIATTAVHHFRERWRKKFGKSIRHWLVTELGHEGTENLHMHGILFTNESFETIEKIWQYGFIWPTKDSQNTNYVNAETINYITKYVTKVDELHKTYKPITLTSPGIGSNYITNPNFNLHIFNNEKTNELYRTTNGTEAPIPIYWRNKIFTDEQKELLWLIKLDKNERFVCGEKVKADNIKEYYKLLKWHRRINEELGYGNDKKNWEREKYEQQQRIINMERRLGINENGYPANWDT